MEDGLGIFVVEPEDIGFGGFDMFGHPYRHGVLGIFFEPVSFPHDDLVVVETLLVFLFFIFKFFLIVVDDFELFAEMVRYVVVLEHFRCFFLGSGQEVNIFHFLALVVGDHCCRIVEFHACGIGVEEIGYTEFGILFEEVDPDEGGGLARSGRLNWLMQIRP